MQFMMSLCLTLLVFSTQGAVEFQERKTWAFDEDGVSISNEFPTARISDCKRLGKGSYEIVIKPENSPVNRSPWYGFRVWAKGDQEITVRLQYVKALHRYHPKVQNGDGRWTPLAKSKVSVSPKQSTATLTLDVGPKPLWVSAQEHIDGDDFETWINDLDPAMPIQRFDVGKSKGGRQIGGFTFGNGNATDWIVIIGRQHPPEVTGTLGLMAFVNRLVSSTKQMKKLRERYGVLVIPFVNPDGVHEGHWRHSFAGVDLNRDWLNFVQPETRQVRDAILERTIKKGHKVALFMDFHSTRRDIFYTQKDEHPTRPKDFTKKWLKAIGERFPKYRVNRSGSHSPTSNVSKGWAYRTFGCPSITYEFGDETNRDLLTEITQGAADEMAALFLSWSGE